MTSLFLDHNDTWIVADLDADPLAWSRDLVGRRARQQGLELDPERVELLARVMVPALELSRSEDPPPVMVLFLSPFVDQPIVTSVRVRAEGLEETMTLEEFADEARFPAEMLDQPALTETVETRSGPALHLVQRYREPISPEEEQVKEHEAYAWVLDDYDGPMLVTLSTTYTDLVDAGDWRSELAELASTLVMA
jgi:hypothetical protein